MGATRPQRENAKLDWYRFSFESRLRADSVSAEGEKILVNIAIGKAIGKLVGGAYEYIAGKLGGTAADTGAQLGNKLDFILGKSGGNNAARSIGMLRDLESIGVSDTPVMREYLTEHLNTVLEDATSIVEDNGIRQTRESLLMGPYGGIKVESIWEGQKLITVMIYH